MQKKEENAKAYAARMVEQFKKSMERLRKLGAHMISDRGRRMMYVPGNVSLCSSYPVDMYGTSLLPTAAATSSTSVQIILVNSAKANKEERVWLKAIK